MTGRDERPPHITDAELSVLDVIWRRESPTIREITDELYPEGKTSNYTTVQKLLERLEDKGCVRRDRSGYAHRFTAALAREELIDLQLAEMAEKLCDGSFTPILTQLVESRRLGKKDLATLRELFEERRRR